MPQKLNNGIVVPINSDAYNLTADLAAMGNSTNVAVPVTNQAARDAMTPFVGMQVSRQDRDNWIQTYNGSVWEYRQTPKRVYANVSTFNNTAGTATRLLLTFPGLTKPYAQMINATLKLTISCPAIATGVSNVNAAVSINASTISGVQGRAAMAWVAPGNYLQSATTDSGWIQAAATTDPLVRAWVEVTSGSVNTTVSSDVTYSEFFVDVRPADD